MYTRERRLARLLLMTHDRIIGGEIVITHEFMSLLLGVRRASVTMMLRKLPNRGLIELRDYWWVLLIAGRSKDWLPTLTAFTKANTAA